MFDDCVHESVLTCECECEHWCWHEQEWECRAYECDCPEVQDASARQPEDDADFTLKDAVTLVGAGTLALGALSLFTGRKKRDGTQVADAAPPPEPPKPSATLPPAGWYADNDGGPARWWDGGQWTEHRQTPQSAAPGWYDDDAGSVRWWDGGQWTVHTAPPRT